MNFFSELRRRNVFRVGIAYIVAAWLLLQITDVLMSVLALPGFVGKVVILLLIIGLIPALIISWAYEITPEGLKRDGTVAPEQSITTRTARKLDTAVIVMLIAVGALVIFDRLVPGKTGTEPEPLSVQNQPAGEEAAQEKPADARSDSSSGSFSDNSQISLAVLPFTNMSPDPNNEFFADGISEELLNVLVDVEGLRVPSRTSSFAFKGEKMDIREIASQLRVNHVLEGSVRKAGDQVRITAQLVDVTTDTHLWSETYDRRLQDIFAIQDEIAGHIAAALKLALDIEATGRSTDDLEAYTRYLHGRELLRARDPDGLLEADRLLAEATELDPEFADAWAARAMVQVVLPGYLKDEVENFRSPAKTYADQALAIDPSHAEAMLVIGQIYNVAGELNMALEQLEASVREHPGNSTGHLWFAIALAKTGYLTDAFRHIKQSRSLDPVHPTVLDWYARIAPLGNAPRPNASEHVVPTAERALQLGREQARVPLFQYFLGAGSAAEMARYIDSEDDPNWGWMLGVFPVRDDPNLLDEAMQRVEAAEQQGAGYVVNYWRLNLLMVAGESAAFFEQVESIEAVDDTIGVLVWLPVAERHRGSPAMQTWVAESGLAELWRERGRPDLCQPFGNNRFDCTP